MYVLGRVHILLFVSFHFFRGGWERWLSTTCPCLCILYTHGEVEIFECRCDNSTIGSGEVLVLVQKRDPIDDKSKLP